MSIRWRVWERTLYGCSPGWIAEVGKKQVGQKEEAEFIGGRTERWEQITAAGAVGSLPIVFSTGVAMSISGKLWIICF